MEQFFTRVIIRLAIGLVVGFVVVNFGKFNNPAASTTTRPPAESTTRQVTASSAPLAVQPSANPTPTTDARLDSLWTLISDAGLSYHLSGTGVNKNNGSVLERFTMELDVSGDNYSGRVNSIGSSGNAQLVRLDGVMYARPPRGPWVARRVPTDSVLQFAPFLDIRSKGDLKADGVQTSGRLTLYRYASTGQYQPDVAHMMDLSRFPGRCDVLQLELLVTDAAVPVSAHFECDVNNNVYSGASDYKFTSFGRNFSIKAPTKPPA